MDGSDSLDLILETKQGTRYVLSELDITVRDFVIDSLEPVTSAKERRGVDGHIYAGTSFKGRTMRGSFYFEAYDSYDYLLLRNDVFRLFGSREEFWLYEARLPRRRWLVTVASPFSPTRESKYGFFDVEFISASPYAESVGSLLDPFTFEAELWDFATNIPFDDFSYVHTTRQFEIWNLGDVAVDPRNSPQLEIRYTGASNGLTIENQTTGEIWRHLRTTGAGQTLLIDGVKTRLNGIPETPRTNRAPISLAPGKNDIRITGTSGSFEVAFDFRFLFV